jgi:ankyrin repeat protein
MDHPLKEFIRTVNLEGLQLALLENPSLANQGIPLDGNATLAHPLHRICDGVFNGVYSDEQAAEMARLFLTHGAYVDGDPLQDLKDTPTIAAASLQSDSVALLYIEHGANIFHAGCHGGTALHWAAWCGRDKVVKRLLEAKAEISQLCFQFKSTPLFWGVHGYKFGGDKNRNNQVECVRLLVEAGADKSIPNFEGYKPIELLESQADTEMINLLK